MVKEFSTEIEKYVKISDQLRGEFERSCIERNIKKNETLVEYGGIYNKTFFIINGSFKSSTFTPDGLKKTIWFYFDDLFRIIPIKDGFLSRKPTKYEIVALEDSTILEFDMVIVDSWINNYPEFNQFFRYSMINDFMLSEEIRTHLICYSKEDFLKYLYKKYPIILLRAPSHAIADFMGITREWYSKIKKNIM